MDFVGPKRKFKKKKWRGKINSISILQNINWKTNHLRIHWCSENYLHLTASRKSTDVKARQYICKETREPKSCSSNLPSSSCAYNELRISAPAKYAKYVKNVQTGDESPKDFKISQLNLTFCLVLIILFNVANQKLHSSQSLVVRSTCCRQKEEKKQLKLRSHFQLSNTRME